MQRTSDAAPQGNSGFAVLASIKGQVHVSNFLFLLPPKKPKSRQKNQIRHPRHAGTLDGQDQRYVGKKTLLLPTPPHPRSSFRDLFDLAPAHSHSHSATHSSFIQSTMCHPSHPQQRGASFSTDAPPPLQGSPPTATPLRVRVMFLVGRSFCLV